MPRKKKDAPITGISSDPDNKLTVQKSNPLTALWRSELTLAEFKILDAYLSRIDSHKPEKRSVRFEKGEIEKLLGVKKINIADLKKRVGHLMQPLVIDSGPRGFRGLCLFEEAVCISDANGIWQVDLECSQKAMQYFFNIESLGYLRYKLRCIAGLTSRYSYILFIYLESNRFRKTWEIDFGELKHLLSCDNETTYQQFYRFNDLVLKKCWSELNEKTECHFDYTPIKKGRTVTSIRFVLETFSSMDDEPMDPNQMSFDDMGRIDSTSSPDDLLRSAIPEFTGAEYDAIFEVLVTVPDDKLPHNVGIYDKYGNPDITFRRYHYLCQKLKLLDVADERAAKNRRPIKNRFAYFLTMLKADAKPEEYN